jgi:hypothetical protein
MRINIVEWKFWLFKYDSNRYSSFVFETIKLFKNKFRNNLKCKQSFWSKIDFKFSFLISEIFQARHFSSDKNTWFKNIKIISANIIQKHVY